MLNKGAARLGAIPNGSVPNSRAEAGLGTEMPCTPNIFSTPPNMMGGELELALAGKAYQRHNGTIDFYGRVNFLGPNSGQGMVKWAKATANWTNVTGNGSYVTCRKVDDRSGTNPGDSLTVYLPRTNDGDPNVRSGKIIAYALDADGEAVCVSPYMDDKIGSLKAWNGAIGSIPGGWTVNTSLGGRVPAGYISADATYGTIGNTGGATTHSHAAATSDAATGNTGNASGNTGASSGNTASAMTGVTVDSHTGLNTDIYAAVSDTKTTGTTISVPTHTHTISFTTSTAAVAAGTTVVTGITSPSGSTAESQALSDPGHFHTSSHAHAISTIPHTVNDAGHVHGLGSHVHDLNNHNHSLNSHTHGIPASDTKSNLDPYYVVAWLERTS